MKIVHLTACFHPVVNGVTRMVELYARHQQAAGHHVSIVTHGNRHTGEPAPLAHKIRVMRNPGIPLGNSGYFWPLHFSAEARQALAEADIIHAHHLFLCINPATKFSNAPIVYTNHTRYDLYAAVYNPLRRRQSLPTDSPYLANMIMRRAWPQQTNRCQKIIAPSPEIKEIMRQFGVTRPIVVIPNGIETARFRSPQNQINKEALECQAEDIVALYIGRLAVEKEIGTLLEAFKIAQRREPRLRLVLVGPGPLRPKIERQIKTEKLDQKIKLLDPQPSAVIPTLLAAADFFVTASRSEVHPLTLLEAIAAGLPVVVPDSEPLYRWVEPVTGPVGLIAHQKPGETLAEALARQLFAMGSSPSLRTTCSKNTRSLLPKIDIQQTVHATQALYQSLDTGSQIS